MLGAALRFAVGTATVAASGWMLRALQGSPRAVGARPDEIWPAARRSPNYRDGVFVNVEPAATMNLDSEQRSLLIRELIGSRDARRPPTPIPLAVQAKVDTTPLDLAASWYGHSSALIEVDGYRVLTDPIWSRRCSPSQAVGPERMHEAPVPLEALPALDAVLISHDQCLTVRNAARAIKPRRPMMRSTSTESTAAVR